MTAARAAKAALAIALALACAGEEERSGAASEPRRNLILISIDTLRADRLGAYGYDRDTSPTMDALSARGVRFETAIAESSWTLPAHMTLFTGLPPTLHRVKTSENMLAGGVPLLAEILREHGYRAFAFTGGAFLAPHYGFARGFEVYVVKRVDYATRAEEPLDFETALRLAADKIEKLAPDERFFVFVHTYHVHCPYDPPPSYAARFETRPARDHVDTRDRCGNPHYNAMSLTPGQAHFISDRYDASIRHADDLLKSFFDRLQQVGVLDDTFVTLLSDHGEEFLEHGRIGHQGTLFIETLRIPWIIAGPGLAPRVVSEPVGLADVMPTLLALLGIPAPPTEGVSMLPVIEGRSPEKRDRPRFSEQGDGPDLRSAVLGEHHLIANARSNRLMLFDWRADPLEQSDLIGSDPVRDTELQAHLSRYLEELATAATRARTQPVSGFDEAQRARLRALGYGE